jgi:acetoin utilization protein AcuB
MYVKNKMTSNPYTISPDATIAEALELREENWLALLLNVKCWRFHLQRLLR